MNEIQAAELLLRLKVAFPKADDGIDELTTNARDQLYQGEFAALRADTARQAVQECIRTCKWFPTIAEIRQRYDEAAEPRPSYVPPALPPAGEGWETRSEAAKRANDAVQKILNCEHVELARAGRLKSNHPCFRQCVHAKAYFKGAR